MSNVRFSHEAQKDLLEIADWLSDANTHHALLVLNALEECCSKLADMPHMGRARDELAAHLRSLPCDQYVIFYYPKQKGVDVVRVLHCSRDIDHLL